ncbi:MAG: VWA domain-containing protein [Treponema sp.]|jgi:hypothetical protein|nr:VWA domain-containing protein [Treponema sp.]
MKNLAKKWGIIAICALIGLSLAGCDGIIGDNVSNLLTPTGLYMGIIGFNDRITQRQISLLSNDNKSQFQNFVDGLSMRSGTGLYYAVDKAIDTLENASLPDNVASVSIITFTDGLDNYSIELNNNYNSRDAYRDYLKNRISSTKIKNLNISAYSIGIKGNDVADTDAFNAGLLALASDEDNCSVVSNMSEVNKTFEGIAEGLYNESQVHTLKLGIRGGFETGIKVRFTFDNVTDAANSTRYIEGIYDRESNPRRLTNVVYEGLISSSGTTVNASQESGYTVFTFVNVTTSSGGSIVISNTKQWTYLTSSSIWVRDSEFNPTDQVKTTIEKKSAVIMLVLDCTSSLGAADFQQMKTAANDFIDVLTNDSGDSGNDNPTPGSLTPLTANVWKNGTLYTETSEDWYSFTVVQGATYYIWWNDIWKGDFTKTGDIVVSARYANSSSWIFGSLPNPADHGWDTPQSFTASQAGTVQIRVVPYKFKMMYVGTYGIVYSTSSTRPE